MLNSDYKEMLLCLKEEGVKFLLVGAYAMAGHGYVRATMDIDIWVKPESENSKAVIRALKKFGAYLHDLCAADLENDDTVFQIGVPPRRIDILTGVSGLDFDITFANSTPVKIECIELRIPSIQDLIKNKKSSGRIKDLADADALEKISQ